MIGNWRKPDWPWFFGADAVCFMVIQRGRTQTAWHATPGAPLVREDDGHARRRLGIQPHLLRRRELSCSGKSEIAENGCRRSRSVQRVEVQSWRTFAQELLALERRVFDAEPDDFLSITALFQTGDDDIGQIRATEGHETLDL